MRIFYGAVLALVVLAVGGGAVVYSGAYNVAASADHTALGKWIMHTTMHNSVEASAKDIDVPGLDDNDMIKQGAQAYDSLCAACHLKPGLEDTVLRAGLNPMPPTLMEQGHWEPAGQFWIIKHGIKMTGMPAWGVTHEDEELWEMVAFLQRLPGLSEQEYQELVQPAASSTRGQADDGHDHEHGDMSAMMGSSSNAPKATHDDGHDHDHGDMSGMMDSSESGTEEERADSESTSPDEGNAEADDHYADGHTH